MKNDTFKKIVSFALVAIMTLSLCWPGLVTSYATQDTGTIDSSEQTKDTEKETEEVTEETSKNPSDNKEYTVTLDDGAGGGTLAFTDTNATEKKAHEGETIEVKLTPDEGFKVQALYLADPDTYEVLSTAETEDDRFSFKMPARDVLVASGFIPIDKETDVTESETASPNSNIDDSYVYDGEQFTLEPELTKEEAAEYVQDYKEFIEESLKNGDVVDSDGASVQSEDGIAAYSAEGIATYAANKSAELDYTFWAIPKGAGFGNIWEDGRDLDHVGIITLKEGSTYHVGYCVHHNSDLNGGHTYQNVEAYLTNSQKKNLTGRALYYGFHTFSKVNGTTWNPDWALSNGSVYPTANDMAKYVATQVMVWIIEKGWYSYSNNTFSINSKASDAATTICKKSTNKGNSGDSLRTYKAFQTLLTNMTNYDKIASFTYRVKSNADSGTVHQMGYNYSTGKYELKLTDSNGMLRYTSKTLGLPTGASASIDGNVLTITSTKPFAATTITLQKKSFDPTKALIVWSDTAGSSWQQVGTYNPPGDSALNSYVRIQAGSVSVRAVKNWDDSSNAAGIRPGSITVNLMRGDEKGKETTTVKSYTLNEKNGWKVDVDNLPLKQSVNGGSSVKHIYYTFTENTVANYSGSAADESKDGSRFVYTITNKPTLGYGYVQKVSTDTGLTNNNGSYSLAGAEYTIYKDTSLSQSVGKLTTKADGSSDTSVALTPGTYYAKETKASPGFQLDTTTHTLDIKAGQNTTFTSKEIPLVSVYVQKQWNDGDNKFGTRPSSIKLELWSGATNDVMKMDTKVQEITLSSANNWTATVSNLPDTNSNGQKLYYGFWESNAAAYYTPSYSAATVNGSNNGYNIVLTNTLQKGYLRLLKVSHDPELTSNNGNYSLAGAVYTVYTNPECTTKATYFGELKTDANGSTGNIEILPGTYYVKETTAPKGYKLDEKVYTATVGDGATVNVNSKEPPLISVSVTKNWNDDANKFGVRPASIVLTLYSGSVNNLDDMHDTVTHVTLDASNNWSATVSNLPQTDGDGNRIYYGFWEDNVPGYYTPVYTTGALNGTKTGYDITIRNDLQKGYLDLKKTSGKPDLTNGNSNYSLAGAVYTVYTDEQCTKKATYFGELRTNDKGETGKVEILPGTYYVKETTAPASYQLSSEVFKVTVADKATVHVDAVDTPVYSKLSLKKVSADEGRTNGLTDGNACYSLEGAEYYVYTDAACKTRAKDSSGKDITLVTKADGTTNEAEVVAASYYVREMKASKGYYLDDCNTKTPHSVTLELGKNGSVTCTEKPMNDPFRVTMSKKSYKNGVEITNNAPSLEGAIFEVDYYQNTDGKTSGTPDKKWYFKTDENGKFVAGVERYYVQTATLDDGTIIKSDSLYKNEAGTAVFPLGTYTLREVKAPTYYEIKGTATVQGTGTTINDPSKPLTFILKTDPETGRPAIYDGDKPSFGKISVTNEVGITYSEEVYEGSLKVVKYGDNNKPLAGVKFKLAGDDGSVYTGTTDKNGVYTFKELMPQHYVLTETEAPDGYTLLKDNVDVNIPYEVSDQKAKDAKMDTSKAVHDASKNMYYFYDITYNIKNGQAFPVVYTGGDQTLLYIGMAAALAMIGLGGFIFIRRRKER